MASTTRPLTASSAADAPAIQALFDADPAFFTLTEGAPARPDEAARLFTDVPPGGRTHIFFDGRVLLEVLEGHPTPTTWYLGLIFVAPSARGGIGTAALEALCAHAKAHGGTALRLAVHVDHAAARRLYDRLGFAFVARRPRETFTGQVFEYDVLERAL